MRNSPCLLFIVLSVAIPTVSWCQAGSAGDVFTRDDIFNRMPLSHFKDVVRSFAWFRGELWVGTYGSGILVLSESGDVRTIQSSNSPLLEDRVNCLAARGDQELWIGTCEGINVHDGTTWKRYTTDDGVAHNIYHAIRIAPDGRVWVGTTGHGISVFDGTKWTTYNKSSGLGDDWIDDILIEPGGKVWATCFHTLAQFEGETITKLSPVGAEMPYPILSLGYRNGEIWVGTVARGVFFFQDGYWFHPESDALAAGDNKIRSMVTDQEGRVWMGTDLGIVRYTPDQGWKHYGTEEGLAEAYTKVLFIDGKQRLWAGSWIDGVVSVYVPNEDRLRMVLNKGKYSAGQVALPLGP